MIRESGANNPRASIYVRNSKAVSGRNKSQEGMVSECRELATEEGLEVVAVHVDNGKSGVIRDRPAFLAWLADAEQGRAEVLLSWAGDRLTREGANVAGRIMDVVEGKDPETGKVVREPVRLLTYDDGIDSSQGDYWRRRLNDATENARAERGRMERRSQANRKRLKAAGQWPSGLAPYGTMFDCPTAPGCVGRKTKDGDEPIGPVHACSRLLVPNPAERVVLQEVASRLVAGEGMRSILRWLHDAGHTTRRGNAWTRTSLTTTLESETTRGHAADMPEAKRFLSADWKPVFTLTQARALQDRLHPKAGTRRPGGRPQSWLLSGLATCAGCGRPLTTGRDAKRNVTRYVCPTTTSAAPCEARATIRADRADAEVAERFLELWGDLFWFEERVTVDGAEVDAAERARDAAQAALLADLTPEAATAYAEAKAGLETALAKPTTRRVEHVATETYGVLWERAVITDPATGETKPDAATRAALLRGAAEDIKVSKSTGPTWDPSRIEVLWRARPEVVSDGEQTEESAPW